MVDKDYTKIEARFRRYRIEYIRWMGQITVQVDCGQLKADMGPKGPSSFKRKRGKRGSRAGKARARRQISLQPEGSGPPLKHSRSVGVFGLPIRYEKRHQRLIDHAYLFFSRWYEMKKQIDRNKLVPELRCKPGKFGGHVYYGVLPTLKRCQDMHKLGVDTLLQGRLARSQVDALRGNLPPDVYLLRKNMEWYRLNVREDTDEAPQLVDPNRKLYKPPHSGSGPAMLKLECPTCGFRRASVLSKCRCGYIPMRAHGPTRTGKTAGFLSNVDGTPVGSKASKSTRRGFR